MILSSIHPSWRGYCESTFKTWRRARIEKGTLSKEARWAEYQFQLTMTVARLIN